MARLPHPFHFLRVLCCTLLGYRCFGAVAGRSIADEDVENSLGDFVKNWGKHARANNFSYCQKAYAEDASLYALLGPAAESLKARAGLDGRELRRGRHAIEEFWTALARGIAGGLRDMRVYEDKGPYVRRVFVVDDDTVIISGQFALPGLTGRVLSSTWKRGSGGVWAIKSDMLEVEYSDLPLSNIAAEVPTPVGSVEPDRSPGKSTGDDATSQGQSEGERRPPDGNLTGFVEEVEDEAEGAGHTLFWMVSSCAVIFVVFYMFRAHRRRSAMRTVGGPDTLLG